MKHIFPVEFSYESAKAAARTLAVLLACFIILFCAVLSLFPNVSLPNGLMPVSPIGDGTCQSSSFVVTE